jgi:hypothetical protein
MNLLTTSKCEEVYCQYLDNSCDGSLDALLERSVKVYMDHSCTTPKQWVWSQPPVIPFKDELKLILVKTVLQVFENILI